MDAARRLRLDIGSHRKAQRGKCQEGTCQASEETGLLLPTTGDCGNQVVLQTTANLAAMAFLACATA